MSVPDERLNDKRQAYLLYGLTSPGKGRRSQASGARPVNGTHSPITVLQAFECRYALAGEESLSLAYRLVVERGILLDGDNETVLAVGVAAARTELKHTWRYLQAVGLVAVGVKLLSDCAVVEHFGCIVHGIGYIEMVRRYLDGCCCCCCSTNLGHVH